MTDEEIEKYFEDKCGTYFESTQMEIKEDVCTAFKDGYNKGTAEAKEIIRRLLSFEQIPRNCLNERYRKLLEEAEQFLKESKE